MILAHFKSSRILIKTSLASDEMQFFLQISWNQQKKSFFSKIFENSIFLKNFNIDPIDLKSKYDGCGD